MESNEIVKLSVESEDQPDDKKILVLSHGLNGHLTPASAIGSRLREADRIRGVTRSLVVDALAVLDEMWDDCQKPPALREKYHLLYHYLDYIKRFCDGRA